MTILDGIGKALLYCRRFGVWHGLRLMCTLHGLLNWRRADPFFKVSVPGLPASVQLRRHSSDRDVFEQIFIGQHYDFDLHLNPALILDCGANVGISTLYFAARYPAAAVLAIEPDAAAFEVLSANASHYPNVTCLHAAVWGYHAPLTFVNSEAPSWERRVDLADSAGPLVKAITIQDLLQSSASGRIGLLKMDVQGAEKAIFDEQCHTWLARTEVLMVELHDAEVPSCSLAVYKQLVRYEFQMRQNAHTVCIDLRRPDV
jgi:FkbM family methyltransferase